MLKRRRRNQLLKRLPDAVLPFFELASARPADLRALQEKLADAIEDRRLDPAELIGALEELASYPELERDSSNLFVASLRARFAHRHEAGLELCERLLHLYPDRRALRSLVRFHERAGDIGRALGILELLPSSDDWVRTTRAQLDQKRREIPASTDAGPYRYFGYRALSTDIGPSVLVYGDMNLNIIDGSSIWLASAAQALTGLGHRVHLLLRENITRHEVIEPLLGAPDIELIEPQVFGEATLSAERAAEAIAELDGLGGYRAVVVRGLQVCEALAGYKTLRKRVHAYLTDFYRHSSGQAGRVVVDPEIVELFADLRHTFAGFLAQTPAVAQAMEEALGIPPDQVRLWPPMIPDQLSPARPEQDETKRRFRLGYAGKLAPRWGITELLDTVSVLRERGRELEVHVVGDKIHAGSADRPHFRRQMEEWLESEQVIWHRGASRAQALELMATMDLAWCFRDPALERHTLELSTKLIEFLALKLPVIATRSATNEELLGAEHPLLVADASELVAAVERVMEGERRVSAAKASSYHRVAAHRISAVRDSLAPVLGTEPRDDRRRIVIAGTDRKFVGELESHLKRLGHEVKRDEWEWGQPGDLERSQRLARWADAVFCEWGLANAVWYSEHLAPDKRLVVRIHQQEVVKRARRFPPHFRMDNIDAIAVVADHIRDKAIEMFDWSEHEGRIVTIPNYLDTELFDRPKHDEARFRVAIVGVVPSQHKRLDRALDVISAVREKDPRFVLVIKGKLPRDMPWMAHRNDELEYFDRQFERIERDLAGGVELSKFDPRLSAWYQSIGCVLSPSSFESFHYSVAEGAASGALPLVWPWEGADRTYPDDWLVDGVESAAEAIIGTMGDSFDEFTPRAEANKRYLRERYGMERVLADLTRLLLGENGSG